MSDFPSQLPKKFCQAGSVDLVGFRFTSTIIIWQVLSFRWLNLPDQILQVLTKEKCHFWLSKWYLLA